MADTESHTPHWSTIPATCGSCKRVRSPGCGRCQRLRQQTTRNVAPTAAGDGGSLTVRCGGVARRLPIMPSDEPVGNARAEAIAAGDGGISWSTVGDRDGWVCHLCGGHVLQVGGTADHPHGANVDHVEPIAVGGAHVWSNVAISHRVCNMAKGSKRIGSLPSLAA